jgi:hypothetical protein
MSRVLKGTRPFTLRRPKVQRVKASAVVDAKPLKKIPTFPFVKIAGQAEMKLSLLLNVVDPNIGGVLVMGDRGTAKSVAVRTLHQCVSFTPTSDITPRHEHSAIRYSRVLGALQYTSTCHTSDA